MAIPSSYVYKDGAYWNVNGSGPYGCLDGTNMYLLGQGVAYTGVYSGLPASPSLYAQAIVTDFGSPISVYWNGTKWTSYGFQALSMQIPMVVMPTGSFTDTAGNFLLGTALTLAYPAVWGYFGAAAINAGSAAGWYYCTLSSTTVGQVFSNTYTSGLGAPPASPGAMTSVAAAYTGTTTEVSGPTIIFPANMPKVGTAIRWSGFVTGPNNANAKTGRIRFTTGTSITFTITSTTGNRALLQGTFHSIGASGKFHGHNSGSSSTGLGTVTESAYSTVDTTTPSNYVFTLNPTVATDWMSVGECTFEILL